MSRHTGQCQSSREDMAPAPARGELRRTLAQMRESLLWEPTTKTESAARSATATAVNSSREGRRRSRDHCPRRRRTHDHGRTRSRIAMGELKLEKKGDAELEKVLAEIDALKTEATEVRVVRKSLSVRASPPRDDDDDLERPRLTSLPPRPLHRRLTNAMPSSRRCSRRRRPTAWSVPAPSTPQIARQISPAR